MRCARSGVSILLGQEIALIGEFGERGIYTGKRSYRSRDLVIQLGRDVDEEVEQLQEMLVSRLACEQLTKRRVLLRPTILIQHDLTDRALDRFIDPKLATERRLRVDECRSQVLTGVPEGPLDGRKDGPGFRRQGEVTRVNVQSVHAVDAFTIAERQIILRPLTTLALLAVLQTLDNSPQPLGTLPLLGPSAISQRAAELVEAPQKISGRASERTKIFAVDASFFPQMLVQALRFELDVGFAGLEVRIDEGHDDPRDQGVRYELKK